MDRTETAGAAWAPEAADGGVRRVDAPADPASHFVFRVNDVPIMVKGANWVPLDAFHSRDAERVDRAVALFADLGCNMIRCWGGNVYEDHRFFDLCDEAGILVWQDFAFACCRYPQTDAFLAEVRREAEHVVAKLRNHPSLAIWCGDNEIDMAYVSDGLSPEHNRLTREVIPQVVHRLDPHRAFVPSSPYVPPSVGPVAGAWQQTPEQHLWGPRGYFKSPFYTLHSAHFIGEIGYHGCPNVSSIRRFISPEKLWPWEDNDEWQEHAVYHWQHPTRDRDRIKLMANQVRELFGVVPDDLESFALASQITQAEAKKFFIEIDPAAQMADKRHPLVERDRRLAAVLRRDRGLLLRRQAGLPLHPPRPAAGVRDRGRAGAGQAPAGDRQQRQPRPMPTCTTGSGMRIRARPWQAGRSAPAPTRTGRSRPSAPTPATSGST